MEEIKEAFLRVKEDIDFLYGEICSLKDSLNNTSSDLNEIKEIVKSLKENTLQSKKNSLSSILSSPNNPEILIQQTNRQTDKQTNTYSNTPEIPVKRASTHNSTIQHINDSISTHNSTDSTHIKPLEPQNLGISTGNGGVPTDKQTNRQTHQQTHNSSYNQENIPKMTPSSPIKDAMTILNSLDNLKKEIRLKFKRLTDQEMTVFTTLYQLCEEEGYADYKAISSILGLTESSIRDYIGRLIKKGIPVDKTKINNKSIQLSVSSDLKKVASLQTIIQLRDI